MLNLFSVASKPSLTRQSILFSDSMMTVTADWLTDWWLTADWLMMALWLTADYPVTNWLTDFLKDQREFRG